MLAWEILETLPGALHGVEVLFWVTAKAMLLFFVAPKLHKWGRASGIVKFWSNCSSTRIEGGSHIASRISVFLEFLRPGKILGRCWRQES
jgi:hypothetical protein